MHYWIQDYLPQNWFRVWVRIPEIPKDGDVDIIMHYGNRYAQTTSNIDETATFNEEFDDLDPSKWSYESRYWDVTDCPEKEEDICLVHLKSPVGSYAQAIMTDKPLDIENGWIAFVSWYRKHGNEPLWIFPLIINSRENGGPPCNKGIEECITAVIWDESLIIGFDFRSAQIGQHIMKSDSKLPDRSWHTMRWTLDAPEGGAWKMNAIITSENESKDMASSSPVEKTKTLGGYIGVASHETGNVNYWDYIRIFQHTIPEPTISFGQEIKQQKEIVI